MKTALKTVVRTTHVVEICYDYTEGVEIDFSKPSPANKVREYAKTKTAGSCVTVTNEEGWCFCLRVEGDDLGLVTRVALDIERYIGRFKSLVLL